MGKHFISVLGAGSYKECVYEMEDIGFAYKTAFAQLAVLKSVDPPFRQGDKITIFATEIAKEANWDDREIAVQQDSSAIDKRHAGIEIEAQQDLSAAKAGLFHRIFKKKSLAQENKPMRQRMPVQDIVPIQENKAVIRKGLDSLLEEGFPQVERNLVPIREGRNRQELDEIFECIYKSISEGDLVYFDFTHGLRNLPMQALAIVNYAKVLKGIQVMGLYYGAYELGEDREDKLRHAPILDMSFCSTLQDWTGAAEAFSMAGSSVKIWKLYNQETKEEKLDAKYREILKSIYVLTGCIETSRGAMPPHNPLKKDNWGSKSIDGAYRLFTERYEDIFEGNPEMEAPLERLIQYIYNDVEDFKKRVVLQGKELPYSSMGIAVLFWACKKEKLQQAYTVFQETIISYVCELYGIPAEDKNKREQVKAVLQAAESVCVRESNISKGNSTFGDFMPKELNHRMSGKKLSAQRIQWLEKWNDSVQREQNKLRRFADKGRLILNDIDEKLPKLYKDVSDGRNTVNHFGLKQNRKGKETYASLRQELHQCRRVFIEILNSNKDIQNPFH